MADQRKANNSDTTTCTSTSKCDQSVQINTAAVHTTVPEKETASQSNIAQATYVKRKKLKEKLKRSNSSSGERKKDDEDSPGIPFSRILQAVAGTSWNALISVLVVVGWTCVCAWYADRLREEAEMEPGGRADSWLGWIAEVNVRVIGSLFIFSLVFRFNQCYTRWWQGRELWGFLIHQSLDFSEKVSLWIIDKSYADRLNRYIIVFPYACKAQLRGLSLTDPKESGQELMRRGLLTQEELSHMETNPCWQPHFFLHLMRAIIAKVQIAEYTVGNTLLLPKSNKIHEKLFAPLDRAVYDLNKTIGDCISVRSAGLPKSYDFVHYIFFWIYFILSPVVWSVTTGWFAPILSGLSSSIIMALINMGTALVDPFGDDYLDLPLDKFCMTIESQVRAIESRSKQADLLDFAENSTVKPTLVHETFSDELRSSHHIRLR